MTTACLHDHCAPDIRNDACDDCGQKRDVDFRDLMRTHQKSLHGFILRRIGNAGDADELTQQAFVAAATSIENFRGEAALSTWLYGIALNLVRNHVSRELARRQRFDDLSVLDDLGWSARTPEEELRSKQDALVLEKALKTLPSAMREVLMLVGVHEVAYEDAALLLRVPVGTVRSRLSRARESLRKRLEAVHVAPTRH